MISLGRPYGPLNKRAQKIGPFYLLPPHLSRYSRSDSPICPRVYPKGQDMGCRAEAKARLCGLGKTCEVVVDGTATLGRASNATKSGGCRSR